MYLCERCRLRLDGTEDLQVYEELGLRNPVTLPHVVISSTTESCQSTSWSIPDFIDGLCELCLGMCQLIDSPSFLSIVESHVKEAGHSSIGQVAVSFSVFPSFYIWERYQCLLRRQMDYETWKKIRDIKELLRLSWKINLGKQFEWQFSTQAKYKMHVRFYHSKSDEISRWLNSKDQMTGATNSKVTNKRQNAAESQMSLQSTLKTLDDLMDSEFIKKEPATIFDLMKQDHVMIEIRLEHENLYIGGRYLKFSRHLSQTPWIIDNQRIGDKSVEELICIPMKELFKADQYRFSSAGREDIDVRMLGNGRPFSVELLNPKVTDNTLMDQDYSNSLLDAVQTRINRETDLIRIGPLFRLNENDLISLKEGEETKKKTYKCLIWLSKNITEEDITCLNSMTDLEIFQKTPIRVLHRRSLATRTKTIHSMKVSQLNQHTLLLQLEAQAGTYIKEFVHGDLGRTYPNIGTILNCIADILQLDVVDVSLTGTSFT